MSARLNHSYFDNLATTRNHKVLEWDSKNQPYTTVHKSQISLFCQTCGLPFTTSCLSYINARQTGCPNCKKQLISQSTKERRSFKTPRNSSGFARLNKKRNNSEKDQSKLSVEPSMFDSIKSENTMKVFLKKESNAYNDFILSFYQKEQFSLAEKKQLGLQMHHIVPIHSGGIDEPWNLVALTSKQHMLAHKLRWEVYKNKNDDLCFRVMNQEVPFGDIWKKANKLGNDKRKEQKSGIYAPGMAQKAGQKGGKKKTENKILAHMSKLSDEVKVLFEKGSYWLHKPTDTFVILKPKQIRLVIELWDSLVDSMLDEPNKTVLKSIKKTTATSALAKLIKKTPGHQSYYGWFLYEEEPKRL
jgi:hypothetical protein